MINVTLYTVTKRENSTARPTVSGTTYSCEFKDTFSIINPQLLFDFGRTGNPSFYNYCFIEHLGSRYYFITDWTYFNGLWVASMEVDVLATWKIAIGNSTQYVLRASAASDGTIVDSFYPTKQGVTFSQAFGSNPWASTFNGGTYVVGIINSDSSGVGAVHYYVFTQLLFNRFCQFLLGDVSWLNISDISEDLTKALFDPFQYIVSCYWFPFQVMSEGTLNEIPLGWWTISAAASRLTNSPLDSRTSVSINVPKHPQAASRGTYLNGAPYSRYSITFPGFGRQPIDANELVNASSVSVGVRVDCIAGNATMRVHVGDAVILESKSMLGIPIQLAQLSSNLINGATGVISNGGGLIGNIMGGNIAGAITSGLNMIGSAVSSALPQLSTSGSNGSTEDLSYTPRIDAEFYSVADEDNEDLGRPLCKKRQLYTLAGYQQILNCDIALPATAEENRRVKSYLETGYFYE